jgi:hypothetical protein
MPFLHAQVHLRTQLAWQKYDRTMRTWVSPFLRKQISEKKIEVFETTEVRLIPLLRLPQYSSSLTYSSLSRSLRTTCRAGLFPTSPTSLPPTFSLPSLASLCETSAFPTLSSSPFSVPVNSSRVHQPPRALPASVYRGKKRAAGGTCFSPPDA